MICLLKKILLVEYLVNIDGIEALDKFKDTGSNISCLINNYYALPHSLTQLSKYRIRPYVHKPHHTFFSQLSDLRLP